MNLHSSRQRHLLLNCKSIRFVPPTSLTAYQSSDTCNYVSQLRLFFSLHCAFLVFLILSYARLRVDLQPKNQSVAYSTYIETSRSKERKKEKKKKKEKEKRKSHSNCTLQSIFINASIFEISFRPFAQV